METLAALQTPARGSARVLQGFCRGSARVLQGLCTCSNICRVSARPSTVAVHSASSACKFCLQIVLPASNLTSVRAAMPCPLTVTLLICQNLCWSKWTCSLQQRCTPHHLCMGHDIQHSWLSGIAQKSWCTNTLAMPPQPITGVMLTQGWVQL